jgi:hypothetical protein
MTTTTPPILDGPVVDADGDGLPPLKPRREGAADNQGLGAALAVVLFVLVVPIVVYNVRQLRASEGR